MAYWGFYDRGNIDDYGDNEGIVTKFDDNSEVACVKLMSELYKIYRENVS